MTIEQLTNIESDLYSQVISLEGSIEYKNSIIANLGIFDEYKKVHQEYARLSENDIEAAKRGLFLTWYSVAEPSCYTGINELDEYAKESVINSINKIFIANKNDNELEWMINYYSNWNFIFTPYKLYLSFWNRINNPREIEVPHYSREAMSKRGQMGIYWNSLE